MRGAGSIAVVFAVLAVGAGDALAAPDGQLKQLTGPDGCLISTPAQSCRDIPGAMADLGEPAITSDGRFVYVPDAASNAIYAFSRDTTTGVLTFLACRSFADVQGCQTLSGVAPLQDAMGVAVHGNSLYVVGGRAGTAGETDAADGIAHFTLANGVPTFDTCLSITVAGTNCPLLGTPMINPTAVAVSPDGLGVYVAAPNLDLIQALKRNDVSGTLTNAGCLTRRTECAVQAIHLAAPRDIEVTPDNKHVVVTNPASRPVEPLLGIIDMGLNVAVLDRNDPATGVLVPHSGVTACASLVPLTCQFLENFAPTQVAISQTGERIYTVGTTSQINWIGRTPANGDLAATLNHCASASGTQGLCPVAPPLTGGVTDVALSPNRPDLYTAGARIGVWDRAANDAVTPKPAEAGCLAAVAGCRPIVGGPNAKWILPSPDGKHVYGFGSDRIFSFAVDHAPSCSAQTVSTPHNIAVAIQLQCTDPDGDPLLYRVVSAPTRGTLLTPPGNIVSYDPLGGTSGADSFTFTARAWEVDADPVTVTINVGAAPLAIVDADSDGSPATADCNDGNARVRPGVREIPGNAVDENCDGRRGLGRLGSVRSDWTSDVAYTDVTELRMRNTPAGARGQIRCIGDRCRFRRKSVRRRGGTIDFVRALNVAERRFLLGQTIEVRVTAPNYLGKVIRYRIRARAIPGGSTLCLPPGESRPRRRC